MRALARAAVFCFVASLSAQTPPMFWSDSSRLGRPLAKDPSVIRFQGRYLLYYSLPAASPTQGWAIGIAESRNLIDWAQIGEILPEAAYEKNGLCAPFAKVIRGKVELFYQTYGNKEKDAICHASSPDGIHFAKDPTNPVFHPTGSWNAGRAIDAEVVEFRGRWLLYAATRDPEMQVQMIVGASARNGQGFGRNAWKMLTDGPVLKPELPWEKTCVEAPSIVRRGRTLYMFYAGAYNNAPQQIGCARSTDGIHWTRISAAPLLPNGKPETWNSSESGHPGAFVDDDGQTYLFYQGNNDNGHTWHLSFVKIDWKNGIPVVERP